MVLYVPKGELARQTDTHTAPGLLALAENPEDAQAKSEQGGALGRGQGF